MHPVQRFVSPAGLVGHAPFRGLPPPANPTSASPHPTRESRASRCRVASWPIRPPTRPVCHFLPTVSQAPSSASSAGLFPAPLSPRTASASRSTSRPPRAERKQSQASSGRRSHDAGRPLCPSGPPAFPVRREPSIETRREAGDPASGASEVGAALALRPELSVAQEPDLATRRAGRRQPARMVAVSLSTQSYRCRRGDVVVPLAAVACWFWRGEAWSCAYPKHVVAAGSFRSRAGLAAEGCARCVPVM